MSKRKLPIVDNFIDWMDLLKKPVKFPKLFAVITGLIAGYFLLLAIGSSYFFVHYLGENLAVAIIRLSGVCGVWFMFLTVVRMTQRVLTEETVKNRRIKQVESNDTKLIHREKVIGCFLILAIVFSFSNISRAKASDAMPFVVNSEINTYVDTRIVVSYAFTQNVSSDANSAGKSVWQVNIDPLSTVFSTSAADKFYWYFVINYGVVVDQDVTVALFSGDKPVDSWMYSVKTDRLVFRFDITVTQQPEYPTAEELAEKSIDVLRNELQEYTAAMLGLTQTMRQNMTTQWAVIIFVAIVAILQLWNTYVKTPKRREE